MAGMHTREERVKVKRYASELVFSFGQGLCFGNESPDRSHRLRSDLACEMSSDQRSWIAFR